MSKVVLNESYSSYLEKGKQSFSLVELAIYIVAVGILTGIAVGGMEVVNNAKIQKITEEMDSYRSSLYLFQATYQVLPGNVTQEVCERYNEFNNVTKPGQNDTPGTYCTSDYVVATSNDTLLATEQSENSFLNAMRFLVASGIKPDASRTNLYNAEAGSATTVITAENLTYKVVSESQGVSSYSNDAAYTYVGFSGSKTGMAMVRGLETAPELDAAQTVANLISGKNVLVFYSNQNVTTSPTIGVLNPLMAKKLSVKIDNNTKPMEGRLLALKNAGNATKKCYDDTTFAFLNSKDSSAGCNMIYVL